MEALAHVKTLLVVLSGEVVPTENVKNVPEVVQAVCDVGVIAGIQPPPHLQCLLVHFSCTSWVAKLVQIDCEVDEPASNLWVITLVEVPPHRQGPLMKIGRVCVAETAAQEVATNARQQ
jgi:hypothetical protein